MEEGPEVAAQQSLEEARVRRRRQSPQAQIDPETEAAGSAPAARLFS